jgi:hypothetical protein
MRVDDVGCVGLGQQPPHLMGSFTNEADNVAAAKEPPQLYVAWRAAHLGNNRRSRQGNDAHFKSSTVVSPDRAVITIGGDQHTRVVDDAHAE